MAEGANRWRPVCSKAIACCLLLCGGGPGDAAASTSDSERSSRTSNLLKTIAGDAGRLLGGHESWLILGAGLAGSGAARPFDQDIAGSRFNAELFEDNAGDRFFESGEILGGAAMQLGSALGVWGLELLAGSDRGLGSDLFRAQALTQGVTQAIKYSVGRTRPDRSSSTSFPSGHASGTFATAAVLHRHFGDRAGVAAYLIASYVAASRLSENKHYLSDVVFGAAVGIAAGRAIRLAPSRARHRLSFAPVGPSTVAVRFSVAL